MHKFRKERLHAISPPVLASIVDGTPESSRCQVPGVRRLVVGGGLGKGGEVSKV